MIVATIPVITNYSANIMQRRNLGQVLKEKDVGASFCPFDGLKDDLKTLVCRII